MNERPEIKKTTPSATATPIEDFGERHWKMLLIFEDNAVRRERNQNARRIERDESSTTNDLLLLGFISQHEPGDRVVAILSDRGWEVAGQLRRWQAEGRALVDFVAVRCGACTRIRYGERRPCDCGGSK